MAAHRKHFHDVAHNMTRPADAEHYTSSAWMGHDGPVSRALDALENPAKRKPRTRRPVTVRRFSWE